MASTEKVESGNVAVAEFAAKANGKSQAVVRYRASIQPRKAPLPDKFAQAVLAIESALNMKVFMLLQDDADESEMAAISDELAESIAKADLPNEPIILLIHSLGGLADSAYKIVLALRQKCGEFISFVPVQAKSAATLITMGGSAVIMPPLAHLGPIDAQVFDYDLGGRKSALEVVQAVERLRAEAMDTLKQSVMSMYMGTRLPFTTILPHAVQLTCGLMQPLLDHVDVNQYMRMSRTMKIGEEYAVRIMEGTYGRQKALDIARHFAQNYPEHGFVICAEEVAQHLHVEDVPGGLEQSLSDLGRYLGSITALGTLEQIKEKPSETS